MNTDHVFLSFDFISKLYKFNSNFQMNTLTCIILLKILQVHSFIACKKKKQCSTQFSGDDTIVIGDNEIKLGTPKQGNKRKKK